MPRCCATPRGGRRSTPKRPWRCGPRRHRAAATATRHRRSRCTRPGTPRSGAGEERFVQPQRRHLTDPGWVIDQRGAVGDHSVHHSMPITAELTSDLRNGAAVPPDLATDPPASPVRHPRPRRCDRRGLLGPRAYRAVGVWAAPAPLVPHQHRRTPERRQVHQRHLGPVLHPRPGAAPCTADGTNDGLDMD